MNKLLLVLSLALVTIKGFAHQPDVSTTMLVEKENNTWVLQISASLTAFQQEIRTHFSETPYETPEEFQQMVLEHIKNNLQLSFNGDNVVTLSHGIVILGHETKVVFEVFGIPATISSAEITNTAFKDIHRSQSALVLLKEGFNKKQFVLNDANSHTVSLKVDKNEFIEKVEHSASFFSSNILIVLIGCLALGILIQNIYKRRKLRLLEVG